MSGKAAAIFGWARLLAPMILANIPQTRGIAGKVATAMDDAEALKDSKSGPERKAYVLDLAKQSLETESAVGHPLTQEAIDAALQATSAGINTAFNLAEFAQAAHGDPASGADVHLPTLAAVAQGVPIATLGVAEAAGVLPETSAGSGGGVNPPAQN